MLTNLSQHHNFKEIENINTIDNFDNLLNDLKDFMSKQ